MICDFCGASKPTTGAVLNGKFGQACKACVYQVSRQAIPGSAQYSRDRDREDNLRDLIQPWTNKGLPNREFILAYPEESKSYFTPSQLEQYS